MYIQYILYCRFISFFFLGKQLLVVNGAFRGCKATLEALDMKNYCVSVKICQGPARGRIVDKLPYEDVSKLNTE